MKKVAGGKIVLKLMSTCLKPNAVGLFPLVLVSLKPGVLKRGRLRRLQKVLKLDSKMWTSQEIQESTNLMGVTMTMPEGHAILDCGAALDCIGEVAAARTAQAITASGETRRPAVVDKIQWKRRLR